MASAFFDAPGETTSTDVLQIIHAQNLAAYLLRKAHPWARFVEARITVLGSERVESIVFDVDVELSQLGAFDIRPQERICVSFTTKDETWPETLALRQDFPTVPHLNLTPPGVPRCLCLYEQHYSEERLRWASVSIVERVRVWLSDTARGVLHKEDQPLEPIFLGTRNTIVLPADIYSRAAHGPIQLQIACANAQPWGDVFVARHLGSGTQGPGNQFLATIYISPPVLHGVIHWLPQTLLDLHTASVAAGGDLLGVLREQLSAWPREKWFLDCHLVLIALFPKLRHATQDVETYETWVFVTGTTIGQIGEALGIWQLNLGIPGQLIGAQIDQQASNLIALMPLNPTFQLDRAGAARLNGTLADTKKIAAVGMGALGSQIIDVLVRGGYGLWSLIDSDVLLPHNIARHVLGQGFVGAPKAEAMKVHLNSILSEPVVERVLFTDLSSPKGKESEVSSVLEASEAIVDFSASVSVARELALRRPAQGRRVSIFMNPSGSASVMLCEDSERLSRLDCLEMQYYRAILSRKELADHFSLENGPIRYARSCRDVSNAMPQHRVSLHAALTAYALREALTTAGARIRLWSSDNEGGVRSLNILPEPMIERQIDKWKLVFDAGLVTKLEDLRRNGLPKETGGVLLGMWDVVHGIVYVADTIAAPPDSKMCTTCFIRGREGLLEAVTQAGRATGNMLQYIGEWHSHPTGYTTAPSHDDCKLFDWISEKTTQDGYEPVMAIVGEPDIRWFIKSISPQTTTAGRFK